MSLTPSSLEAIEALILGFAFAGVLSTGFACLTGDPPGFRQLEKGGLRGLATVPVLVFSAPFVMVGAIIRGARAHRQPIPYVMIVTMIACGWSLLSGRLVLDLAQAIV